MEPSIEHKLADLNERNLILEQAIWEINKITTIYRPSEMCTRIQLIAKVKSINGITKPIAKEPIKVIENAHKEIPQTSVDRYIADQEA